MEEQIIEVEYNKDLVEEYKNNYIMETEGIGAGETEVYDTQTKVNEVPFEDMIEEGEVIIEGVVENDKNN